MEEEILELSPSPASTGLPTLNSLGSMPERGSCAAFPASTLATLCLRTQTNSPKDPASFCGVVRKASVLCSYFPRGMGLHRGSSKPGRLLECHLNISTQLRRFQEDLFAQVQCLASKFTGHLVSMSASIVARAGTLFSKNILNSAVSFW